MKKLIWLIFVLVFFCSNIFAANSSRDLTLRVSQLNSNRYPNIKAYVTVENSNGDIVSGINNNSWSADIDSLYSVQTSTFPFSASSEYISYNIIFSNSLIVGSGLLNVQTQAILNLVGNIAAKDKISVYTMGDQANVVCEDVLRDNFDFSIISTLEATNDRSRVYDSIADVLNKIAAKSDERKVLIIISDEKDYTSVLQRRQFEDILTKSNVPVYSIGVRRPSESVMMKLEDISELSGGRYYYQPMTRELSNTLLKICDYINSAYIVNLKADELKADNLPHTLNLNLGIKDSEGSYSNYFIALKNSSSYISNFDTSNFTDPTDLNVKLLLDKAIIYRDEKCLVRKSDDEELLKNLLEACEYLKDNDVFEDFKETIDTGLTNWFFIETLIGNKISINSILEKCLGNNYDGKFKVLNLDSDRASDEEESDEISLLFPKISLSFAVFEDSKFIPIILLEYPRFEGFNLFKDRRMNVSVGLKNNWILLDTDDPCINLILRDLISLFGIEFYSSNTDVVKINRTKGSITTLKEGKVLVTAVSKDDKLIESCIVEVNNKNKNEDDSKTEENMKNEDNSKAEKNTVSVRLLTDNAGVDDKSFNASAWRGIERFYHNGSLKDKKYSYILCKTNDEFLPTLRQSTDEANDLIIASGFFWADAINQVAGDNPDQKYMLIDAKSNNLKNVCNALFQEETGSYLVGVLAARQAEIEGIPNPKFGFIGGIPSGTLTRFEVGFIQGVKSVLPNAEIVDYYANSFSAPELGKVQAKNFYDNGVYCIFTAAGATGSGAIAQAKEYRLKNRNVWIIGVDSDQYEDGLYNEQGESAVLTSMLKLVENATWQVLNELQNGKWLSGVREFDLAMDCVGYSISNPRLSPKAIEYAENARADIISGKIKVEKTYKDAQRRGLVPSGLRAVDD